MNAHQRRLKRRSWKRDLAMITKVVYGPSVIGDKIDQFRDQMAIALGVPRRYLFPGDRNGRPQTK